MKKKLLTFLMYFTLIALALIFLLPILYVFYNALLPYRYVQTWAPISVWTLDNFKELFTQYPILRWYWNTFLSTVIVVAGNHGRICVGQIQVPWQKNNFWLLVTVHDGAFSAYDDTDVYPACQIKYA